MRHLMGVVLAIVMTGLLFFAGAWGYLRLTALTAPLSRLPAGGGSLLPDHGMLAALVAIAGTGLLAGILIAAPRISPLAAGLPGLLLLGWTAFYVGGVRHAVHLIPLKSHPYGAGFEAMLVHGILGAAGLAMIIPLFVPSRWRARSTAGPRDDRGRGTPRPGPAHRIAVSDAAVQSSWTGRPGRELAYHSGQAPAGGLPRRLPDTEAPPVAPRREIAFYRERAATWDS